MKRFALFAMVLASSWSVGQEYPRYELSASYAYGSVGTQSSVTQPNAQGWGGSLTANLKKWVGLEGEVSGRYNSELVTVQGTPVVSNSQYYTFLAGPRIAYRKGKATPYVHTLFGMARSLAYENAIYDPTSGTATITYGNVIGAAMGGGLDYAISRRLSFRSQADYMYTHQAAATSGMTTTPSNFRVMAGIVFTFGGGADLESRRRNDAPVMAASAPTQNLATKEMATPVAEERRDAVSPMPVENVTSAKADLNTETASAAAPLASTAQAPVQSPIIPTVVQGMTSQLTSPRSEPVPQAPPVASSNAIPQTKQPAASEANAALMQQALGPKSNTVVISTRDLQAQPQQEESLGDVARRYQEQKRLKGDN